MALKIDENAMMTTGYHVNDGPKQMYLVDARMAASAHPEEWSMTPWAPDDASAARARLHDRRVAEAKAAGQQPPPDLVEPVLSDEDKAAFDEWKASRDKAQAVLDAAAKEQAEADAKTAALADAQAAADAPPPQPDPTRRRPLTGAAATKSAEKAARDRAAADKAAADKTGSVVPAGPAPGGPFAGPAST